MMEAFVMYDLDLDEWYVSIYDRRNPENCRQFFGYATEQQARDDVPYLIRKMQ